MQQPPSSLLLEVLCGGLRELRLGLVREVLVDVLDDLGGDARQDLEEVVVRLELLQQDVDVLLHRLCNIREGEKFSGWGKC